jgi:DNA replication protein DnaC
MRAPDGRDGRADEIRALALRAQRLREAPPPVGRAEPGCWCAGAGGRGATYLPDPLGVGGDAPHLLRVCAAYCPCDAGRALRATEDALRLAVFAARDALAQARLWGAAGVPPHYRGLTLETFPATPATAPAVARVREWLATDDRWLLLWGPYGTGKTGLAVAALGERVRVHTEATGASPGARFITVPDMLARLRHSYAREARERDGSGAGPSERELLDDLSGAPLLVLDDLGAERATDWAVEQLFGVLNRRHDWHRQTVLTSNLSPRQLAQHAGERTAWRILEMCRRGDEAEGARFVVELRGPNLRDRAGGRDDPAPGRPGRVLPGAEPSHRYGTPLGGARADTQEGSAP